MVYEIRQPVNYAFGTLKNAAAIGDTSIVSDDFITALPAGLTTSIYVPITLQDPASKVFEIVWVTAHTAAANTATVVRGKEATAARAWPSSTLWTCAPTLRDGLLPCTRATLPADPHIGLRVLLSDEQRALRWSGTQYTSGETVSLAQPNALLGWTAPPATFAASTTYTIATVSIPDPGWPYYIEGTAQLLFNGGTDGASTSHSSGLIVDTATWPATTSTSFVTCTFVGVSNSSGFGMIKLMRNRCPLVWTGAHTVNWLLRTGVASAISWTALNVSPQYQFNVSLIPA